MSASRAHRFAACTLLFLVLFACPAMAAAPRVLGQGAVALQPSAEVLSQSESAVDLEFHFPSLLAEDVTLDGQTYQILSIPGGAETGEVGAPMLPTFSRLVMIPDRTDVRVTVSLEEFEELSGYRVLPMQSEDGAGFALDPAAYSRVGFGNAPLGTLGSPALFRGLRVVSLLLSPVQFSPAEGKIRIARTLRVNISFEGENPLNAAAAPVRKIPPTFDRLFHSLIVNYEGPPQAAAVEGGSWVLICADYPDLTTRLQPLVDWRKRMGYPVRVATTTETGTTKEQIQAWLRSAYQNWEDPPEYIVLAGDGTGTYSIPTFYEQLGYNGEGDHPYGQLDGNDILLDAHVGRLSFSNLTELEVIVAKTVGYESTPNLTDPAWFTRATLVGDPYDSGYSTVQVQQWIKTRLRQIGYTQIDTIFDYPFASQMQTSLNRGGTIFCYRGIYGMSGWTNTNTTSLTNYNKLYYGVMSTCGTGSFASGTARSEVFLRTGTTTAPKGAVGAIGTATTGTHTRFNNCFTFGLFQGLLYEDLWEMGAALTRGKNELYLNYNQTGPNYVIMFSYWNNLMGDPACRVWTAFPQPLNVTYPSTVPFGSNSVQVTVRDEEGGACEGAQVCFWKGSEVHVVGRTDATGHCELALNALSPGVAKLTVTKHDCAPLLADVAIANQGSFVGYQASAVDDDGAGASQGNGDGRTNPAEAIELRVQLRNFGLSPADQVTAILSTTDPYATMIDAECSFGTIQPGALVWGADSFNFSVAEGCPDEHVLRFGLDVHSGESLWHSLVELPVVSARLGAGTVTLYNAGNGRLDPGEALEISIPLTNEGGTEAGALSGTLSSLSPWVRVTDPAGQYGTLAEGATAENTADRFAVRAETSTYQGHLAVLCLVGSFNGGAVDTTYTSVTVGQCSSDDPVGPDRYGYYAFDNTDTGYPEAPVYQWIEINPSLGGSGAQVQLGDYSDFQDRSRAMNLPFAFKFYGEEYSRVTICSNGWIAMGDTYLTEYRNWTLPGAGAPQNLIAPFWDDLVETSNGHVYQYYDAPNHRFIVEWSRMQNTVGYATETFQAILYDPAFHETSSGDGIIVFQYSQISNTDSIDGYSTVGIQNWDHTDGLLYTYFNLYPPGAANLAAGRAIRIVPMVVDVTGAPEENRPGPALALEANALNPFRGSTVVSFSLDREGPARLTVHDVQGRSVRRLLDGRQPAGAQSIRWNGADDLGRHLPSGVYFYRLEAGGRSLVRKVMKLE